MREKTDIYQLVLEWKRLFCSTFLNRYHEKIDTLSLSRSRLLWMANAQNPAWGPQSKVVTDSIYSQVLKAHRAYTIYLPQSYSNETDRKYPILYLLHGMSGVNTSGLQTNV